MRRRTVLLSMAAVAALVVGAAWLVVSRPLSTPSTHGAVSRAVTPAPDSRGVAGRGAPSSAQSPAPAQTQGGTVQPARVQRSARVSLDVGKGRLDSRIDRVLQLVSDEGGFVAGAQPVAAPADDGSRTGRITFQVPTAKFDDTLVALRKLGTTTDLQLSGVDVSGQYVDLQARLANAQAQRDAYLALLNRAQTIQDIIAIQDKLGGVTGQIEEYQGQLDALNQSTTYGTITVSLTERPGAPAAAGAGAAFAQAGSNLAAIGRFSIVALGTLAPFLLIGAIVLGAWWRWRRRPRPAPASS